MNEFVVDNSPETKFSACTGQIIIVKKDSGEKSIFLKDDHENIYPLTRVSILSENYSKSQGTFNFPKPFVVNERNEILEEGAKVLIEFPFGKGSPVIKGCINSFGAQFNTLSALQFDINAIEQEMRIKNSELFELRETMDVNGNYSFTLQGGAISFSSNRAVNISAPSLSLRGDDGIAFLSKIVEVGGLQNRLEPGKTELENKAEEVNIFAKIVTLGHSNHQISEEDKIPVDEDGDAALDDPRLQWVMMGGAWKQFTKTLMKELKNAIYLGGGSPARMSPTTKRKLDTLENKIDKVISKTTRVLFKPDQIKK